MTIAEATPSVSVALDRLNPTEPFVNDAIARRAVTKLANSNGYVCAGDVDKLIQQIEGFTDADDQERTLTELKEDEIAALWDENGYESPMGFDDYPEYMQEFIVGFAEEIAMDLRGGRFDTGATLCDDNITRLHDKVPEAGAATEFFADLTWDEQAGTMNFAAAVVAVLTGERPVKKIV